MMWKDGKKTLMKCGHVVNATLYGKPYCIRCNCSEVEDMTNRIAQCRYCGKYVKSDPELPFFRAGKDWDNYCCPRCL